MLLPTIISTKEIEIINTNVSPNPANDIINIDLFNFDNSPMEIEFYNSTGVLIDRVKTSNNNINIATLPQGMIFVLISNNDKIYQTKFIKI